MIITPHMKHVSQQWRPRRSKRIFHQSWTLRFHWHILFYWQLIAKQLLNLWLDQINTNLRNLVSSSKNLPNWQENPRGVYIRHPKKWYCWLPWKRYKKYKSDSPKTLYHSTIWQAATIYLLPLDPLEALSCFCLSRFFSFDHTWIPSQVSSCFLAES
jgi:hypothetical protein